VNYDDNQKIKYSINHGIYDSLVIMMDQ